MPSPITQIDRADDDVREDTRVSARLAVYEPRRGRIIVLDGPVTIGREIGKLTFPEDSTLARQHFELSVIQGRIFIECLAAPHPTRVNGEKIPSSRKLEIHLGDRIEAGDQKFEIRLQVVENPEASARPEVSFVRVGFGLLSILTLLGLAFALGRSLPERAPGSVPSESGKNLCGSGKGEACDVFRRADPAH